MSKVRTDRTPESMLIHLMRETSGLYFEIYHSIPIEKEDPRWFCDLCEINCEMYAFLKTWSVPLIPMSFFQGILWPLGKIDTKNNTN